MQAMVDDRDFSWMGRTAPAAAVHVDRLVWRVEKDSRWAEARVRSVPHGEELRFVVGGLGRDESLMQSTVYAPGDGASLGEISAGTLQNFIGHGWALVAR